MMDILLYAIASFYFIWSTLEVTVTKALTAASSVPLLQSSSALKTIDTTVRSVVLPSASLRVVSAGVLSLLTYPFVSLTNSVLQIFVYWIAFFGLAYLSISQNTVAHQLASAYVQQAIEWLKTQAPQQFNKISSLNFFTKQATIPTSSSSSAAAVVTNDGDESEDDDEGEEK